MKQAHLDELLVLIKEYFKGKPAIAAVYLFGSTAKGVAKESSDIDIAVLFRKGMSSLKRFAHKLEMSADLENLLRLKTDLVDLESVDLFFLRQIMRHKVLLVDQDIFRRVTFEVNKRREYFDRQHFYDLYHRESLKRLSKMGREIQHG